MGKFSDRNEERYARKEAEKLERREREERERRGKEKLQQGGSQAGGAEVIRTEGRPYERAPQVLAIGQGIAGVVERKNPRTCGTFQSHLSAVGYLLRVERDGEVVHTYFSRDHPLWVFDIYTGNATQEPHEVMKEGLLVTFPNFPEPLYHRNFTSHDGSGRAFEPHVRTLVGSRVNDMARWHEHSDAINRYQMRVEDFLRKVSVIFREANQY